MLILFELDNLNLFFTDEYYIKPFKNKEKIDKKVRNQRKV
jgi:hypothetical protein